MSQILFQGNPYLLDEWDLLGSGLLSLRGSSLSSARRFPMLLTFEAHSDLALCLSKSHSETDYLLIVRFQLKVGGSHCRGLLSFSACKLSLLFLYLRLDVARRFSDLFDLGRGWAA